MGRSKSSRARRRDHLSISNGTLPTRSVPSSTRSAPSLRSLNRGVDPFNSDLFLLRPVPAVPDPGYVTQKRSRPKPRLRLVEDRRTWHPERQRRAARGFNRAATRVVAPRWAPLFGAAVTAKLAFSSPPSVAICVRRKQRREVMFALKKSGKRGQRRPRRSWYSSIKCRR